MFRVVDKDTDEFENFSFFDDAQAYFREIRVNNSTHRIELQRIETDEYDKEFCVVIATYIPE